MGDSTQVNNRGLAALPGLLAARGCRRVLVITGESRRHVGRLLPLLTNFAVEVFAGARQHVPLSALRAARSAVSAFEPDVFVSLGGGSATGLGKALKLERPVYFVAIPTTYSGSERTSLYGITSGTGKKTGRDDRVRPDVALYDVDLTLDMPVVLTVTSLLNALAHPLSALSAEANAPELLDDAEQAIEIVYSAAKTLIDAPGSRSARQAALVGAGLAAQVIERGKLGLHHRLAHELGGRFGLDHSGLHSVLLPHSVHRMRRQTPEVLERVTRRLGVADLEASLFDLLRRAGAATSLRQLGLSRQAFDEFLEKNPELPADLLLAAYLGRRPSRFEAT